MRIINPSLAANDRNNAPSFGKLPQRLLLVAAISVLIALLGFMFIPGGSILFVHYWVYLAVAAAVPVLLLASLTVALYRKIAKRILRLIVMWSLIFVILIIVSVAYSLCSVYNYYGLNPVSYYTNPDNGNRVVIMKSIDTAPLETSDNPTETRLDAVYTAYPMVNKYFYLAYSTGNIVTNTGVDFVDWSEDGMIANVHLTDKNGEEQILDVWFDFEKLAEKLNAEAAQNNDVSGETEQANDASDETEEADSETIQE